MPYTGGPGCSSLDGYLYEHGPFHVSDSDFTKLVYNNATWAKQANMVYLEAPAGVGFSYSDESEDYKTNDDLQALDNLQAMEKFFEVDPKAFPTSSFLERRQPFLRPESALKFSRSSRSTHPTTSLSRAKAMLAFVRAPPPCLAPCLPPCSRLSSLAY